jgi:hypothetical protein
MALSECGRVVGPATKSNAAALHALADCANEVIRSLRLNAERGNETDGYSFRARRSALYASIYQEIKSKGKDSRFRKTERGKFAATAVA